MKYVDEFRDHDKAQFISNEIKAITEHAWTIMEVCGGQTHTILQYGIEDLLPSNINLVHGPGCPVCVTPLEMIDHAISIAGLSNVVLCSFGDMLRVPGSHGSLLDLKAHGADIRIVYSPLDALKIAQQNKDKEVVFFAVGFETTAPANAMSVWQAKQLGITNFSILCSHVTVPPIMQALLEDPENQVQGFLGPGHVCSIMGYETYEILSAKYHIPIVITGFEPIDLLQGILSCVKQLESGIYRAENQYSRAVNKEGNIPAQKLLAEVFEISDRAWRGIGVIPKSGYALSRSYKEYDAQEKFPTRASDKKEPEICISGEILRGLKKPPECPAFATTCTPEHPLGATMVSSEGACAAYYKFGKL
jgi:hydrogenase expression/formation protein HypD